MITVERGAGNPLSGLKIYAFTAADEYIGLYGSTDSQGHVAFILSSGSYRFRADQGEDQAWSTVLLVTSDAVTEVGVELEP